MDKENVKRATEGDADGCVRGKGRTKRNSAPPPSTPHPANERGTHRRSNSESSQSSPTSVESASRAAARFRKADAVRSCADSDAQEAPKLFEEDILALVVARLISDLVLKHVYVPGEILAKSGNGAVPSDSTKDGDERAPSGPPAETKEKEEAAEDERKNVKDERSYLNWWLQCPDEALAHWLNVESDTSDLRCNSLRICSNPMKCFPLCTLDEHANSTAKGSFPVSKASNLINKRFSEYLQVALRARSLMALPGALVDTDGYGGQWCRTRSERRGSLPIPIEKWEVAAAFFRVMLRDPFASSPPATAESIPQCVSALLLVHGVWIDLCGELRRSGFDLLCSPGCHDDDDDDATKMKDAPTSPVHSRGQRWIRRMIRSIFLEGVNRFISAATGKPFSFDEKCGVEDETRSGGAVPPVSAGSRTQAMVDGLHCVQAAWDVFWMSCVCDTLLRHSAYVDTLGTERSKVDAQLPGWSTFIADTPMKYVCPGSIDKTWMYSRWSSVVRAQREQNLAAIPGDSATSLFSSLLLLPPVFSLDAQWIEAITNVAFDTLRMCRTDGGCTRNDAASRARKHALPRRSTEKSASSVNRSRSTVQSDVQSSFYFLELWKQRAVDVSKTVLSSISLADGLCMSAEWAVVTNRLSNAYASAAEDASIASTIAVPAFWRRRMIGHGRPGENNGESSHLPQCTTAASGSSPHDDHTPTDPSRHNEESTPVVQRESTPSLFAEAVEVPFAMCSPLSRSMVLPIIVTVVDALPSTLPFAHEDGVLDETVQLVRSQESRWKRLEKSEAFVALACVLDFKHGFRSCSWHIAAVLSHIAPAGLSTLAQTFQLEMAVLAWNTFVPLSCSLSLHTQTRQPRMDAWQAGEERTPMRSESNLHLFQVIPTPSNTFDDITGVAEDERLLLDQCAMDMWWRMAWDDSCEWVPVTIYLIIKAALLGSTSRQVFLCLSYTVADEMMKHITQYEKFYASCTVEEVDTIAATAGLLLFDALDHIISHGLVLAVDQQHPHGTVAGQGIPPLSTTPSPPLSAVAGVAPPPPLDTDFSLGDSGMQFPGEPKSPPLFVPKPASASEDPSQIPLSRHSSLMSDSPSPKKVSLAKSLSRKVSHKLSKFLRPGSSSSTSKDQTTSGGKDRENQMSRPSSGAVTLSQVGSRSDVQLRSGALQSRQDRSLVALEFVRPAIDVAGSMEASQLQMSSFYGVSTTQNATVQQDPKGKSRRPLLQSVSNALSRKKDERKASRHALHVASSSTTFYNEVDWVTSTFRLLRNLLAANKTFTLSTLADKVVYVYGHRCHDEHLIVGTKMTLITHTLLARMLVKYMCFESTRKMAMKTLLELLDLPSDIAQTKGKDTAGKHSAKRDAGTSPNVAQPATKGGGADAETLAAPEDGDEDTDPNVEYPTMIPPEVPIPLTFGEMRLRERILELISSANLIGMIAMVWLDRLLGVLEDPVNNHGMWATEREHRREVELSTIPAYDLSLIPTTAFHQHATLAVTCSPFAGLLASESPVIQKNIWSPEWLFTAPAQGWIRDAKMELVKKQERVMSTWILRHIMCFPMTLHEGVRDKEGASAAQFAERMGKGSSTDVDPVNVLGGSGKGGAHDTTVLPRAATVPYKILRNANTVSGTRTAPGAPSSTDMCTAPIASACYTSSELAVASPYRLMLFALIVHSSKASVLVTRFYIERAMQAMRAQGSRTGMLPASGGERTGDANPSQQQGDSGAEEMRFSMLRTDMAVSCSLLSDMIMQGHTTASVILTVPDLRDLSFDVNFPITARSVANLSMRSYIAPRDPESSPISPTAIHFRNVHTTTSLVLLLQNAIAYLMDARSEASAPPPRRPTRPSLLCLSELSDEVRQFREARGDGLDGTVRFGEGSLRCMVEIVGNVIHEMRRFLSLHERGAFSSSAAAPGPHHAHVKAYATALVEGAVFRRPITVLPPESVDKVVRVDVSGKSATRVAGSFETPMEAAQSKSGKSDVGSEHTRYLLQLMVIATTVMQSRLVDSIEGFAVLLLGNPRPSNRRYALALLESVEALILLREKIVRIFLLEEKCATSASGSKLPSSGQPAASTASTATTAVTQPPSTNVRRTSPAVSAGKHSSKEDATASHTLRFDTELKNSKCVANILRTRSADLLVKVNEYLSSGVMLTDGTLRELYTQATRTSSFDTASLSGSQLRSRHSTTVVSTINGIPPSALISYREVPDLWNALYTPDGKNTIRCPAYTVLSAILIAIIQGSVDEVDRKRTPTRLTNTLRVSNEMAMQAMLTSPATIAALHNSDSEEFKEEHMRSSHNRLRILRQWVPVTPEIPVTTIIYNERALVAKMRTEAAKQRVAFRTPPIQKLSLLNSDVGPFAVQKRGSGEAQIGAGTADAPSDAQESSVMFMAVEEVKHIEGERRAALLLPEVCNSSYYSDTWCSIVVASYVLTFLEVQCSHVVETAGARLAAKVRGHAKGRNKTLWAREQFAQQSQVAEQQNSSENMLNLYDDPGTLASTAESGQVFLNDYRQFTMASILTFAMDAVVVMNRAIRFNNDEVSTVSENKLVSLLRFIYSGAMGSPSVETRGAELQVFQPVRAIAGVQPPPSQSALVGALVAAASPGAAASAKAPVSGAAAATSRKSSTNAHGFHELTLCLGFVLNDSLNANSATPNHAKQQQNLGVEMDRLCTQLPCRPLTYNETLWLLPLFILHARRLLVHPEKPVADLWTEMQRTRNLLISQIDDVLRFLLTSSTRGNAVESRPLAVLRPSRYSSNPGQGGGGALMEVGGTPRGSVGAPNSSGGGSRSMITTAPVSRTVVDVFGTQTVTGRLFELTSFPLRSVAAILVRHDTTELIHLLFDRRAAFQETLVSCNKWMSKAFYYLTKQLNHLFTGELQVFSSATAMRRYDLTRAVDLSSGNNANNTNSSSKNTLAVSISVDAYTIEDVHCNLESLARSSLHTLETVMDHQRQLSETAVPRPQQESSRSMYESFTVRDLDSASAGEIGGYWGYESNRTPAGSVGARPLGQRALQAEKMFRGDQCSQQSKVDASVKDRMMRMFTNTYWKTLSFRISQRIEQSFLEGKRDLTLSSTTPSAPSSAPVLQYPVLSPMMALRLFPDIAALLSKNVREDVEYAVAAMHSLRRSPHRTVQHALFLKVSMHAWVAMKTHMRKVLRAAADEEIMLEHGLLGRAQKDVKQSGARSASCLSAGKVERGVPQSIDELRAAPRDTRYVRKHSTPDAAAGAGATASASSASSAHGSSLATAKMSRAPQREEGMGFATFSKGCAEGPAAAAFGAGAEGSKELEQLSMVALHALLAIEMQQVTVEDMMNESSGGIQSRGSPRNSTARKVSDILMQEPDCVEFLNCVATEIRLMLPRSPESLDSPNKQEQEEHVRVCSRATDMWIETLRDRERSASDSATNLDFRRLAPSFFLKHIFTHATALLLTLLGMHGKTSSTQQQKGPTQAATLPLHVPAKTSSSRTKAAAKDGASNTTTADASKQQQQHDRAQWLDGSVAGISRKQLVGLWHEESTQSPRWHFLLTLARVWGRLALEMDVSWSFVETLLAVTAGCEAVGGWLTYSAALAQETKQSPQTASHSASEGQQSRQSTPLNAIQQVWCSLFCENRSNRASFVQYRKAALAHCLVTHTSSQWCVFDPASYCESGSGVRTSSDSPGSTPRLSESQRILEFYLSVVTKVDRRSTAPVFEAPPSPNNIPRTSKRVLCRSVYYHVFLYTMIYLYSFRKKCSLKEDHEEGVAAEGASSPSAPHTSCKADRQAAAAAARVSGTSAPAAKGSSRGSEPNEQAKAASSLLADLESGALYYMERERTSRLGAKMPHSVSQGPQTAIDDFLLQCPSADRQKGKGGAAVPKNVFEKYQWRFANQRSSSAASTVKSGEMLSGSTGTARVNRMVVKRIFYGSPESHEFIPWVWMTECIWDSVDELGSGKQASTDANLGPGPLSGVPGGLDVTAELQRTLNAMTQSAQSEADVIGAAVRQILLCGSGASVTIDWLERVTSLLHYSTWSLNHVRKLSEIGFWGCVHNDLMYIDAVEGPIVHVGMGGDEGANWSGLQCTIGVHDCGASSNTGGCVGAATAGTQNDAAAKGSASVAAAAAAGTADTPVLNPSDSVSSVQSTSKSTLRHVSRPARERGSNGIDDDSDGDKSNDNSEGGTWMVHTNVEGSSASSQDSGETSTWSEDTEHTAAEGRMPAMRTGPSKEQQQQQQHVERAEDANGHSGQTHRCWHEEEYYAVRTQTAFFVLAHLACVVPQSGASEAGARGGCHSPTECHYYVTPTLVKRYVDILMPVLTHLDLPMQFHERCATGSQSKSRVAEQADQLARQQEALSGAQAVVSQWCYQLMERAASSLRPSSKPQRSARDDLRGVLTPRRGMAVTASSNSSSSITCVQQSNNSGINNAASKKTSDGQPAECWQNDSRPYVNDVRDLFDTSVRSSYHFVGNECRAEHQIRGVEPVTIRSVVERMFEAIKMCNVHVADLIADEMISWTVQHSAMASSLGPKTYTDVMLINPLRDEMTSERLCCCAYISSLSLQLAHVLFARMSVAMQDPGLHIAGPQGTAAAGCGSRLTTLCVGKSIINERVVLQRRLLLVHSILQRQLRVCPHESLRAKGRNPFWLLGSVCVVCQSHFILSVAFLKMLLRNFTALEICNDRSTAGGAGGISNPMGVYIPRYPAFRFPSEFSVEDICEFGWTAVALLAQIDGAPKCAVTGADSLLLSAVSSSSASSASSKLTLWSMACSLMACKLGECHRARLDRFSTQVRCPSILKWKMLSATKSGASIVEEAQRLGVERFVAVSAVVTLSQPFDGEVLNASSRPISAMQLWSAGDVGLHQTQRALGSHGDPNDCAGAPYFAIAQISTLLQRLAHVESVAAPFLAFSEAVSLLCGGHIRRHVDIHSFLSHVAACTEQNTGESSEQEEEDGEGEGAAVGLPSESQASAIGSLTRYLQVFLTTLLGPSDEKEESHSSGSSKRSSQNAEAQFNVSEALRDLVHMSSSFFLGVEDDDMLASGESLNCPSVSDRFLRALKPKLAEARDSSPQSVPSLPADLKEQQGNEAMCCTDSKQAQDERSTLGADRNVVWHRWCLTVVQDFRPHRRHTVNPRGVEKVRADDAGVSVNEDGVLIFQRCFLTYVVRPMLVILAAHENDAAGESSPQEDHVCVPLLFFDALLREAQQCGSRFYLEILECYSDVVKRAVLQCASKRRSGNGKNPDQVSAALQRLTEYYDSMQPDGSGVVVHDAESQEVCAEASNSGGTGQASRVVPPLIQHAEAPAAAAVGVLESTATIASFSSTPQCVAQQFECVAMEWLHSLSCDPHQNTGDASKFSVSRSGSVDSMDSLLSPSVPMKPIPEIRPFRFGAYVYLVDEATKPEEKAERQNEKESAAAARSAAPSGGKGAAKVVAPLWNTTNRIPIQDRQPRITLDPSWYDASAFLE